MTEYKFIVLGDPHFKHDAFYLSRVEEMGAKFIEFCRKEQPDFIVNLGDTLHDHDKIDMVAQCKAVQFMRALKDIAPLYVLIGNHDRINNSEFLTDVSPFNAMKDWPNTFVVDDRVITRGPFFFVPYVPPGRFQEALDLSGIKKEEYLCGFAHQEFKGCKMGAVISEHGDTWSGPPVISGHIHDQETLPFVKYVGTPINHSHGEHGLKTVSKFILTPLKEKEEKEERGGKAEEWCCHQGYHFYEERVKLISNDLKTIKIDARAFLKHEVQGDPRYFRFVITGSDKDVNLVKRSDKYHDLDKLGCRLHFPFIKNVKDTEMDRSVQLVDYYESMMKVLQSMEDENLVALFKEFI